MQQRLRIAKNHQERLLGKMPEWSIGTVSKTVVSFRVPRVRIPLFPQETLENRYLSESTSDFSLKNSLQFGSFLPGAKTKLSSIRTSKSSKIIGVQSEQKFRLCCNPAMKKGGLVDKKGGGILAWTNIPTPESRPAGKQPKNNF